jgi:hypothetical protein
MFCTEQPPRDDRHAQPLRVPRCFLLVPERLAAALHVARLIHHDLVLHPLQHLAVLASLRLDDPDDLVANDLLQPSLPEPAELDLLALPELQVAGRLHRIPADLDGHVPDVQRLTEHVVDR